MIPDALDCDQAAALIGAGIDGELDASNALRLESHLAGCADCAEISAKLAAQSAAIRAQATRFPAPDSLRTALELHLSPPVQRTPPRRWLAARWPASLVSAAAGAALAAGLTIVVDRNTLQNGDMDALVAAHIRALQPGHLIDVPTSDQHVVKPWFAGKVDFSPPVKDLSDQGIELVGGRLDYIGGKDAAVLVYRKRRHLIDLFVALPPGTPGSAASHNGYNLERWSDGGLDYWAVSDLNTAELADFRRLWQQR